MGRNIDITSPMNQIERRAVFSLAGIFGMRMFGLFMILPVLAILAEDLKGSTPFLIGLAMSAYGLTQAFLQIPFGMLSDRFGRKRIIAIGLVIFAAGSVVAATSDTIWGVIAGRALQGGGAIAAAVMALASDLTREVQRTKAMAVIGMSIGVSFAVAVVLGPIIAGALGLHGLFWFTALMALGAIMVLLFLVPNPTEARFHRDSQSLPGEFGNVLRNRDLLRLDFGILMLHMILTASFVVFPLVLRDAGLSVMDHWLVYLPVLVLSMAAAIPFIIIAEKKHQIRPVFLAAILVVALAHMGLFFVQGSVFWISVFLFVFFCGFNLLEATLPSLVSKIAPAGIKGTAMGVYSTSQFFGAFLGGVGGGWLYGEFGAESVFVAASAVAIIWLATASGMRAPRHLSSLLLNVGKLDESQAKTMFKQISSVAGVVEAVVVADDGVAYLKVDKDSLDYGTLHRLVPQ